MYDTAGGVMFLLPVSTKLHHVGQAGQIHTLRYQHIYET